MAAVVKAVVLAGGLGTRLKGRVPDLPKPMAPVAGRPFLEYLLDRLAGAGVREVILSVGYRWQAIADHFGEEYRGIRLRYAVEVRPLGTGGALAHALSGEGDEPVLVLNGDTLLTVDYRELFSRFLAEQAEVGMVLRRVPDAARYGSVAVRDGRVAEFLEKGCSGPGLINAGVYLLKPAIFSRLGLVGRFSLEVDLLQRHREELSPLAFITDDYFIDIGIPEDYDRAQSELPTLQ